MKTIEFNTVQLPNIVSFKHNGQQNTALADFRCKYATGILKLSVIKTAVVQNIVFVTLSIMSPFRELQFTTLN